MIFVSNIIEKIYFLIHLFFISMEQQTDFNEAFDIVLAGMKKDPEIRRRLLVAMEYVSDDETRKMREQMVAKFNGWLSDYNIPGLFYKADLDNPNDPKEGLYILGDFIGYIDLDDEKTNNKDNFLEAVNAILVTRNVTQNALSSLTPTVPQIMGM